jgi:UDP-glucose 4-epimerase
MDESHPQNPLTPYGAGKAAADQLLKSYHSTFDINVTIIRPFNMYGPRQNAGSYSAVIPQVIKRILSGEKPYVEGTGKQTRDFTYVRDVTDVAADIGTRLDFTVKPFAGDIFNLGQGKETPIKDLIKQICHLLNYEGEVEYKPERKADVNRHYANINKAKIILKYKPKTSLKNGLKKTVEWYKENQT